MLPTAPLSLWAAAARRSPFLGTRAITTYLRVAKVPPTAAQLARKQLKAIGKPQSTPPKHPGSSYLLFSKHVREEIVKELGTKDIGAVAKATGARWRALSDSKKQPYVEQAQAGREQYKRDLEKYLANRTASDVILEKKIYLLKSKLGTKTQGLKPPRDVNAPKRPAGPYLWYIKKAYKMTPSEQERVFGQSLTGLSLPDATKLIRSSWDNLDSSEKQEYIEKSDKAKAAYAAESAAYQEENDLDEFRKSLKKTAAAATAVPKKRKAVPKKKKPVVKKPKKIVKKKKPVVRVKKAAATAKKSTAKSAGTLKSAVKTGLKKAKTVTKRVAKAISQTPKETKSRSSRTRL
ncbi:hypothetical protein DFJ77DRAFT_39189 [Powellomyces hirtus]|nr:hypothetical protein DFJ77DRAFT_39189 [Powellomyces hirtus]